MIERRRTPWGILFLLLILVEIVAYYLSGLFLIPGLALDNVQHNLFYIFRHPLTSWWNEKSPAVLGVGILAWLMFVGYYTYNYRNFQYDKEQGSEDWGDPKAISKKLKGSNPNNMRILSTHVQVSKEDDILSNNNMIVVAASGKYKTTGMVETNLATCSASYVMLDVKGATQRKMGNYLISQGYVIRSFNLKEPWLSDRYNPFKYIEREYDLIRLITNLQAAVKKPESFQGDPFWDDGVRLYLQAVFYDVWLGAKENKRFGSMNEILTLVNLENKKMEDGKTSLLQRHMDDLAKRKGADYPPVRDYRKLKEGATETVRSIVIMVNAMLSLCETADLKRIFTEDDINIREIGMGVDGDVNKKVALFLVLPDNDTSFNFLINMFYTQLFDILMRLSDDELHAPLPIPVEMWMDEFYAGPKPRDPEVLMGVIRSRNISMIPILQSIAQLKALGKNDKWQIFFDNASVFAFFGAAPGAADTHEYISKLLGKMTIDTKTDGRHTGRNASGNQNYARSGRELMTPAEVKRMHRKQCLLFVEGESAIYDRKHLIFESEVYKKQIKKAGEYVHPVKVVYNAEKMQYRTIVSQDRVQILSKEESDFYKQAAKTDKRIKIYDVDENEMLYLNWHKQPEPTEEEVAAMFQETLSTELREEETEIPEDVLLMQEEKERVPNFGTNRKDWDLSGTVFDCIKRYATELSEGEMDEILTGLEAGLTDKEIKAYFVLPVSKMEKYRRAYMFKHRS